MPPPFYSRSHHARITHLAIPACSHHITSRHVFIFSSDTSHLLHLTSHTSPAPDLIIAPHVNSSSQKRIATRSTRKADMDRYRHELLAFQEKAKDKRIAVAEEKYETAKTKYDAINDELTHDMPVLLNDRVTFFEPVFATVSHRLTSSHHHIILHRDVE